ncbi:hypothetical protein SLI_1025 [Streptomyces lividans 1326]|uniref:Uncharacterized protein n=1 Tax=Streptomyces lividans 1326 TaxID=1200984 RepID=A0A7U9DQ71_STRLI|nr:hypothetical protein SLI_1025 [Streptomyces lividans 1326]
MQPRCSLGSAPGASGVLRGLRASVLAALCVLLPLAGHVLVQCHAPQWLIVAGLAAAVGTGAAVLSRKRLTDTQLLSALGVAQLAYHAVYSLPDACAAVTAASYFDNGWAWMVEPEAAGGSPPGAMLAGHLAMVLLAARLLGVTERLLWRSKTLSTVIRRLLSFLWPLLRRHQCSGPDNKIPQISAPLKSALLVGLHEGRAPPPRRDSTFVPLRPMPIGGLCLP